MGSFLFFLVFNVVHAALVSENEPRWSVNGWPCLGTGGGVEVTFSFFSSLWAELGVWVILCHHG